MQVTIESGNQNLNKSLDSFNESKFSQLECLKLSKQTTFCVCFYRKAAGSAVEVILCNGIRRAIKVSETCKQAIREWAMVCCFHGHQSLSNECEVWKTGIWRNGIGLHCKKYKYIYWYFNRMFSINFREFCCYLSIHEKSIKLQKYTSNLLFLNYFKNLSFWKMYCTFTNMQCLLNR